MKSLAVISTCLAALASNVSALGINCRGSSWCDFAASSTVAKGLADLIATADDNTWYDDGQHIACTQSGAALIDPEAHGDIGFCAFLQKTKGAYGSDIKGLAPYIPGHGCKVCGSVPYYYPSDNNVADGMLTFNMVTMGPGTACTEGLC